VRAPFKWPCRARWLKGWAFPSPDSGAPTAIATDGNKMAIGMVAHFILPMMSHTQHGPMTSPKVPSHGSCIGMEGNPATGRIINTVLAVIHRRGTSSEPPSKQGYIISNILTQNAHGLRCRAGDEHGNPCPYSPHDYTKYKHLITTMKLKVIDVYFVQETWLKGDLFDKTINGFQVFRHNGEVGNHNFCVSLSSSHLATTRGGKPQELDHRSLQEGSLVSMPTSEEQNLDLGKLTTNRVRYVYTDTINCLFDI
jgi:hypothetical protein